MFDLNRESLNKPEWTIMTTKTRLIYPTPEVPSLHSKSGRTPSEPVPLRWLESLVTDIRAAIPTEAERDSVMLYGADGLHATYTDELTPSEAMADKLAAQDAALREISGLLQGDGEALTPELLRRIRILAGGGGGGPPEPL